MAIVQRHLAHSATHRTRVQNVTGAQTVQSGVSLLQRVVVANAAAAVGTLTVLDGATTMIVLQVPANDTRSVELWLQMATSIVVTPSAATIDALVLYD